VSSTGVYLSRDDSLLEVKDLTKYYDEGSQKLLGGRGKVVKAVDGVSLSIDKGETFGLVGESGSGKSTTGRCILRLIEPTSGQILFDGRNLLALGRSEMRALRREMQIIFQDPYSSLNPRMTVGEIVEEPLIIHGIRPSSKRIDRVAELMLLVGLSADLTKRYPHEFSGGQRQRIAIARALALNPRLVICDEPVSALDVSVQAQIINLLQDLQEQLGLAYLFISHGLGVVRHLALRVGIMYAGKLVEVGSTEDIFTSPMHPYTRLLLASIPVPDPDKRRARVGSAARQSSVEAGFKGCSFLSRCSLAESVCFQSEPQLVETAPGHFVSCFVATSQSGNLK
jgi:oligopeptide transport system ATP-binding protein